MSYRWLSLLFILASAPALPAQTALLTCQTSAVPPTVRAEGIAERTGDILVSCAGGQLGAQVSGNIIASLNVNVTNHILSDGTLDAYLTVNTASSSTTVAAFQYTGNAVAFNGVVFNLGADGRADLRIVNLRGNASQLGFRAGAAISAAVSFTGSGLAVPNSLFIVAVVQRGLLASSTGQLVCGPAGSPWPDAANLTNLYSAGTAYTSTRITEGFASAFVPFADPASYQANSGTRIVARYSNLPEDARLFVPDAITGSTADVPTSSGDLGLPGAGGRYSPGHNQLLLIRVAGADLSGAGGTLAVPVPGVQTTFTSAGELAVVNGSASAVYEVVDANPFVRESAQFPTFLGLPAKGDRPAVVAGFSVNLAPVSSVITQSESAWIPRFLATIPPSDCTALGDCSAPYFPQLEIDTSPIAVTVSAGNSATRYVPLRNTGAGVLRWSVIADYVNGAGWLRISPAQGVNNGTLRVDALSAGLDPGVYQANLVIDGGPFGGTRTIPIAMTVVPAGHSTGETPVIAAVTSAASGAVRTLVAGSLATITGSHLAGQAVQVTFDGTPALLLYKSDQQINLLVPAAVGGAQSARVQVAVDGIASAPVAVAMAVAAPAIFPGAVLNQDNSVNGESTPAVTGTVIQVFATGLPAAGTLTARVHDRDVPVPEYGGPAPGLDGVQQVNIRIPYDLPTMQTYVYVCGGPSAAEQVCSPAAKLWLVRED
jgi:uncharacterized protein (TIGR03437 family)